MRRLSAAGAVIVVCLALGGSPVMAQGEVTAVSGSETCEVLTEGATRAVDGVVQMSDVVMRCTDVMSDPRVSGTATNRYNLQQYGRHFIYWGTHEVAGPDGTWVGSYMGRSDANDPGSGAVMSGVLEGTGDYAGWTYLVDAVLGSSGTTLEGLIYEGPPPPTWGMPAATSSVDGLADPSAVALSDDGWVDDAPAAIGEAADDGASIIAVEELAGRMVDLTIDSPAVGQVKTRLLLPAGFGARADAEWPVLYLLHGAMDDYTSWTRETDVEELTTGLELLVVMPEAGAWGWYSDWYNGGHGGRPMWETFHLTELRQLLERNWQAGDQRVIAGLSMGGFGAMSYAARHPDLFEAAASFSGVLHILDPDFQASHVVWGSKVEELDIWEGHDPVTLAPALEGKTLYASYGDGRFSPLDAVEDQEKADFEASLVDQNEAFADRLEELGIQATVVAGAGTHTWPYWERGLHEALPLLLQALET